MENRIKGTIIHLSKQGWGFVSSTEVPFTRIFFHWTGLNQDTLNFKDLKRGMKIEFETKEFPPRGLRAIKIEVINDPSTTDRGTSNNSESITG